MVKIFADVRAYQNQARAAGFYHMTNLVLCYLHVQIFANLFACTDTCKQRYFDKRSDCEECRLILGAQVNESLCSRLCSLGGPNIERGEL